jgi:hypothetical protein
MTTDTRVNEAKAYALQIADEVRALEAVLGGDYDDLDDDAYSELTPNERARADEAKEVREAMADEAREELGDYSPNFFDYVNAFGLEWVATGQNSGNGWETTGAKMLRTFGGPNCWIIWDGGRSVLVSAYWGGDEYHERVTAWNVADAFETMAEVDA